MPKRWRGCVYTLRVVRLHEANKMESTQRRVFLWYSILVNAIFLKMDSSNGCARNEHGLKGSIHCSYSTWSVSSIQRSASFENVCAQIFILMQLHHSFGTHLVSSLDEDLSYSISSSSSSSGECSVDAITGYQIITYILKILVKQCPFYTNGSYDSNLTYLWWYMQQKTCLSLQFRFVSRFQNAKITPSAYITIEWFRHHQ